MVHTGLCLKRGWDKESSFYLYESEAVLYQSEAMN